MPRRLASVMAAALAAALPACVNTPGREGVTAGPPLVITGVVIRNELPYTVNDVMIEAPASGSFAGCGSIVPRSECSNTFQGVDYQANPVVIRWKEHGQPHQTDEFRISLPEPPKAGRTYVIEVIVFAPGQAGARLADADPGALRNR